MDRLDDEAIRAEIRHALREPSADFENLFLAASSGEGIVLASNLADGTPAAGRSLADVGRDLGIDDPADALLHVVRSNPRIGAAVLPHERGERRAWPAATVGVDRVRLRDERRDALRKAPSTRGPTARSHASSATTAAIRGLFPLEEAIRRMTSLPVDTLHLRDRGTCAAWRVRRPRRVRSRHRRRPGHVRAAPRLCHRRAPRRRQWRPSRPRRREVLDARPGRRLRRG